ncbi:hypothetical protein [Aureimonas frigidaquae]|uniref:Uncharacterized protein n=1 Tax=Aureimonas frigidaquae TaxID=424757 RepID=A0A0P0Z3X3_9HYPH|nr:hypothetical protein [Aureimonas frigidaquae]BAT28727.1 hypothetical protein [Aureimonas frigidaquae]
MQYSDVVFELVKLLLQAGFALFVAWRAVQWALERYKAEKHWERQLSAYSDIVSALGTLMNVLAEWEDQEMTGRGPRGTTDSDLRNSYWSARRKLEEVQSVAMLVLPNEMASKMKELVQALARVDDGNHPTAFDMRDAEYRLIEAARSDFVAHGRVDLGMDRHLRPRKNSNRSASKA